MIPRVTQCGRSFKGAYQYFGHDKQETSRDRVAWVETANMMTRDPDKAWKVMAYTAKVQDRLKEASGVKATGRKLHKPVFSYSLAWHPEQNPDKAHMLETARKSLAALGLTEHECMIIAHRDEPQKHVHILVNRVHPLNGKAKNLGNSKRKLSQFAHEYEKTHGKIYCKQREENRMKREQGKNTKYGDLNIREAWNIAAKGEKSFGEALKERGYELAQGEKRIVVVDPQGKIHDPARHLEGVRGKDVRSLVGEFARASLPNANQVSDQLKQKHHEAYVKQQDELRRKEEAESRLKQKHQKEKRDLEERHQHRFKQEERRLNFEFRMDERWSAIEALSEKVENPKWWRKLLGFTKKDQKKLQGMVVAYRMHEGQIRNHLQALTLDQENSRNVLDNRQNREWESLRESQQQSRIKDRMHELLRQRNKNRDLGR